MNPMATEDVAATETPLTEVERLAAFVTRVRYDDLSPVARSALKAHVLDALGCAIGALNGEPLALVREQLQDFGGNPLVTLIGGALGLEKPMFEAADPAVFTWYIKNYGPEINLFVDHSQIVQLETLRAGIWGMSSVWGRVLTYKG